MFSDVQFCFSVEWRYALYGLVEIECYCLGIVNASVYEHNVFVFAVNELRNEYSLSVALYALEFRGHLCERFRACGYAVACVADICGFCSEKYFGECLYFFVYVLYLIIYIGTFAVFIDWRVVEVPYRGAGCPICEVLYALCSVCKSGEGFYSQVGVRGYGIRVVGCGKAECPEGVVVSTMLGTTLLFKRRSLTAE